MNGGENFMVDKNKKQETTRSNPLNKSFEKSGASEKLEEYLIRKHKKWY
ncbi:hypothetical protein M8409_15530 [Staphylococcus aureus]|nr:hypothetical protein [Staphylococcus aureus]MCL7537154.1 hypothetical protein [Staphylococcus aureus]